MRLRHSNGKTVAVNLSLVVDGRQAQHRPAVSRLFAWIERWFPVQHPPGRNPSRKSLQFKFKLQGRAYRHLPARPSRCPIRQRARDSCEHPSAGRANRTITVSAFNAASPPLKIFGGNAARREFDCWSADQPRDHASQALHGERSKAGEWQRNRDVLACRHRLRRHLLRAVSTGCDRVFERRSGAGFGIRRLERRLLRYRRLLG